MEVMSAAAQGRFIVPIWHAAAGRFRRRIQLVDATHNHCQVRRRGADEASDADLLPSAPKTLMWDRRKEGWTLHQMGHLFDRCHSSIHSISSKTYGASPTRARFKSPKVMEQPRPHPEKPCIEDGPNAAVVLRPERLSDAGPCKRDVARPEGCDPCLSRRLQRLDLDAQLDFRREAHVEREI